VVRVEPNLVATWDPPLSRSPTSSFYLSSPHLYGDHVAAVASLHIDQTEALQDEDIKGSVAVVDMPFRSAPAIPRYEPGIPLSCGAVFGASQDRRPGAQTAASVCAAPEGKQPLGQMGGHNLT